MWRPDSGRRQRRCVNLAAMCGGVACAALPRRAGVAHLPLHQFAASASDAAISRNAVMATTLNVTTEHGRSPTHLGSNSSTSGTANDMQTILNDVIGIWMTGCICLLGIAGNIVSFVVLRRAFGEQSPMFHVLRAMSVSDSVFLLAVFTVQSAVNAYQYLGLEHLVEHYRGYVQYSIWPLLMTTQVRENASDPDLHISCMCVLTLADVEIKKFDKMGIFPIIISGGT